MATTFIDTTAETLFAAPERVYEREPRGPADLEPVRVYRVEHPVHHIGPYNAPGRYGNSELERMYESHNDAAHPSPWRGNEFPREAYYNLTSEYRFAFETVDALRDWFFGYRAMLRRHGFVLAVYEVPRIAIYFGAHQLAFDERHARRVREVRIP